MKNKEKQDKLSYEPVTCKVAEIKVQGVLCSSVPITGGLSNYNGSSL